MVYVNPVPDEAVLSKVYQGLGDTCFRHGRKLDGDFSPGAYHRHLDLMRRGGASATFQTSQAREQRLRCGETAGAREHGRVARQ